MIPRAARAAIASDRPTRRTFAIARRLASPRRTARPVCPAARPTWERAYASYRSPAPAPSALPARRPTTAIRVTASGCRSTPPRASVLSRAIRTPPSPVPPDSLASMPTMAGHQAALPRRMPARPAAHWPFARAPPPGSASPSPCSSPWARCAASGWSAARVHPRPARSSRTLAAAKERTAGKNVVVTRTQAERGHEPNDGRADRGGWISRLGIKPPSLRRSGA